MDEKGRRINGTISIGHDDSGDSNARTLDLLGICCAGVVRVDLLRCRALVEGDEAVEQVVTCCVVVVAAVVVGEVVAQW